MKNLVFSVLAAASLVAVVGCASDMTTSTTSTRHSYATAGNDPKDMSTATTPETPTPTPAPVDTDYPSNGIHTSGNLPGMR